MREMTENGRKIKKRLIDMNLTQAKLSKQCGIPQNRICDIIHSEKYPRLTKRVLEYLGITG